MTEYLIRTEILQLLQHNSSFTDTPANFVTKRTEPQAGSSVKGAEMVIPAQAGILKRLESTWYEIPACAGMTNKQWGRYP